ncbi:MAG: hypothetical protein DI535_09020 [Citrobacter freundii]|nr:MAG: hypothetical protein DI535_09020 [Citrobacter freundii]
MKILLAITSLLLGSAASGQQDTVKITPDMVNTKVLKKGTNRYLVYFRLGKDSSRTNYQLWNRTVDHIDYQGKKAIAVTQEWEDNTKIVHKVYSVCDEKTFAPFFQQSEWVGRTNTKFDFLKKEGFVKDTLLTDADTARIKKQTLQAFRQASNEYVLNWHLDLEVFPILPYKEGRTFMINFYDPGFTAPELQAYTVTGSAKLTGYDNQEIDCWLLTHTSQNNKEVFWVSKKTKEVLKLEQQFGERYRYKIKLGFSV